MAENTTAERQRARAEAEGREAAQDEPGRTEVEAAARGEKVEGSQEKAALDYLLSGARAGAYKITVQFDTKDGLKPLDFIVKAVDGRKIDDIEQSAVDDRTGKVNRITADCEVVVLGTEYMTDENGKRIDLKSEEFLATPTGQPGPRRYASPADALEAKFRTQLGLITGVAGQIRGVSAWSADRVGKAERVMVEATGNS